MEARITENKAYSLLLTFLANLHQLKTKKKVIKSTTGIYPIAKYIAILLQIEKKNYNNGLSAQGRDNAHENSYLARNNANYLNTSPAILLKNNEYLILLEADKF